MEIYQLASFLELARQQNFTRAARVLHLAQPALSQQMRNLESELGAALFHRGRRQTVLTAAGEVFLPQARAILKQVETARQSVAEVCGLRRGRLAVATVPSLSAYWLPELVQVFLRHHPNIELVLQENDSDVVASQVENNEAELGLVQLPVDHSLFSVTPVLRDDFVVAIPVAHALARRKSIPLKLLASEPFLMHRGRQQTLLLESCAKAGFRPRIVCESGSIETVCRLVGAGLGVSLLPRRAIQPVHGEVTVVSLVDVVQPRIHRMLGVISRHQQALSPAARAFVGLATRLGRLDRMKVERQEDQEEEVVEPRVRGRGRSKL